MHKLTEKTLESLRSLGLEGANQIKVFDSSSKGFVIGLGMSKKEAIERGILERVEPNPLHDLCENNRFISHDWIKKHLSESDYLDFQVWMEGQAQSEYGVFDCDVKTFLNNYGI